MKTLELIFIGIKGSVVALDRATGAQVWATKLRSGDFVSVLVEGNALYATTYGELFCLESATGRVLWHNPLKVWDRSSYDCHQVHSGRSPDDIPGGETAPGPRGSCRGSNSRGDGEFLA